MPGHLVWQQALRYPAPTELLSKTITFSKSLPPTGGARPPRGAGPPPPDPEPPAPPPAGGG
ncbi:hypothetical protein, partial [Nocardia brasiliensis]|uniref:hypothetical protein n=1 Tax=Nocardia brasiliensis TaxID=37326 RepID=UPI002457D469